MNNNLDFLWTWAVVPGRPSALHHTPVSQHALICSVLSVAKFYPNSRKRFLVDQATYDLLKGRGWLELWDSVEIVHFPPTAGFQKYYAYPKLYTYRFIERPTVILDVELIATRTLEDLDKSTRVLGQSFIFDWKWEGKAEEGPAERELFSWFSRVPGWERDFFPTAGNKYVTAWGLYIPSAKVGKYVSEKTCNHIDRCLEVLDLRYGSGPACFLEDGYISHCFEEVCGIDFSRESDWAKAFIHSGIDKYRPGREVPNLANETVAGLLGVYSKYILGRNGPRRKTLC